MELKGFDDKKSPLVMIVGAVVALVVGIWILRRIIGTLFLLAKLAVVILLVLVVVAVALRWTDKRNRDKQP